MFWTISSLTSMNFKPKYQFILFLSIVSLQSTYIRNAWLKWVFLYIQTYCNKRKRFGINQEFNFQCHCFCCFWNTKMAVETSYENALYILHTYDNYAFFVVHRPGSLYRCTLWLSWFMQGFWTIRCPLCVHRQLPTIPRTRLFFQRNDVWQHVSL